MNDKLIERIQKLFALATSPVEAEARAAAEKANELLIRHNLTAQDVNSHFQSEYVKEDLFCKARLSMEDKWISMVLTKHFFVTTLTKRDTFNNRCFMILVGERTNIEIAKFVYDFLNNKYKELWTQYRLRTGATVRSKDAYYSGLTKGLNDQLALKRKSVESETGLMVIVDPRLQEAVVKFFPKTTNGRASYIRGDAEASSAGYEQGKDLKIQRGIQSSSGNRGKLLA